jgi:hypothetical protein
MLGSQWVGPEDMVVTFIICFTVQQNANWRGLQPPGSILRRTSWAYYHALTSSYFTFGGQFYHQTGVTVMGSPISPMIADFYIQYF